MEKSQHPDTPLKSEKRNVPEALPTDREMLIHAISHNLQTPIETIAGFCQELVMTCERLQECVGDDALSEDLHEQRLVLLSENIPEVVQSIQAGADSMSAVVAGILRHIRCGYMEIQWDELDMNQIIMKVLAAIEYQMKEKAVLLHIDDLPPCNGDDALIAQVFANLIDNAQKFLDPSRPGEIGISGKRASAWAVYAIADNGIGISSDHQRDIVQEFRGVGPHPKYGECSGLAIVRRIIDQHQGKIEVESVLGKGTTFIVYLPRAGVSGE